MESMQISFTHDVYEIAISLVSSKYVIKPTSKNGAACSNFSAPATGNALKIYVITKGQDILYVGKTNQSLSNRLREGINIVDPHYGYHGYKWVIVGNNLSLHCFTASDTIEDEGLEAIEAELVYNYREETGKWPDGQNEIHFFNKEGANEIAKQLYASIKEKPNGGTVKGNWHCT